MQDRYFIGESGALPSPETMAALLRIYREVSFKYASLSHEYLNGLAEVLENHTFLHWEHARLIIIVPAVSTESIRARKAAIHGCAKLFRQQAFHLVSLLYQTLAIPADKNSDWRELMLLKMKQPRGAVNEDWTYYLHGWECRFENTSTGQIVEVIIANLPECGSLDAHFFLQYLNTTKQFAELRQLFENKDSNVKKALYLLAQWGILTQLDGARDERNLFAG